MATSAMPTAVEKQPQSSVLSMFSGTVLDVVKVSDLEKISDQDTAAGCGVWGNIFCAVLWKCI